MHLFFFEIPVEITAQICWSQLFAKSQKLLEYLEEFHLCPGLCLYLVCIFQVMELLEIIQIYFKNKINGSD